MNFGRGSTIGRLNGCPKNGFRCSLIVSGIGNNLWKIASVVSTKQFPQSNFHKTPIELKYELFPMCGDSDVG